ncbi:MAG TPA: HPr(Ser) kinase/phosphatase [Acidobacteriota bacterium]|nr:HPr(Ser) kinase/phosphatase [Acidobacteriota bacterium]
MAELAEDQTEIVTVREFVDARSLGLDMEVLEGHQGLGNQIRSPRIQKLGLALAGYAGYLHPGRVQVIGGSEMNYLRILDPEDRVTAIRRLGGQGISCIIITRGLQPQEELLELARQERIPVLRTSAQSSLLISKITEYLDARLAPRQTIHGVLLDIFGLGVLLIGPSGIGKSECALELILRGHRLIADDSVVITRLGTNRLMGSCGKLLKHHIELRGLGVIDIRELFGISATGRTQNLDLAVRLERWKPDAEYDRLGLDQSEIEFLGITIPLMEMPVAPGRNVSALVEVAARIQLLRQLGYAPSGELQKMVDLRPCGTSVENRTGASSREQP